MLVQRFNGVLLHDSFVLRTARSNGHSDTFLLFFPNPSGSLIPRVKIIIIQGGPTDKVVAYIEYIRDRQQRTGLLLLLLLLVVVVVVVVVV